MAEPDLVLNPLVKGSPPETLLTFTCQLCGFNLLKSGEIAPHMYIKHDKEIFVVDSRIREVEPSVKPIPSGEVLVFKQHISEDEKYIIECERCPELTLGPAEMGSHAVEVHQRSSFHVETRQLLEKHQLREPIPWYGVGEIDKLPWWGDELNRNRAALGEAYLCCGSLVVHGHSLRCRGDDANQTQ